MKYLCVIICIILTFNLNAQFEDKKLLKHAIGLDIARPIKQISAYDYFSPEIFYRHYHTRYWMIQNGTGINYHKSSFGSNDYAKIYGFYNRIGIHYVIYQNFSFFEFKKKDRKEMGTVGVNFLGAFAHHRAMVKLTGPLLTPYSEYINQKFLLAGIELEWSPILFRVQNFQTNLNFRIGVLGTTSRVRFPNRFRPLTGTGLNDGKTGVYGNFLGINTFYRFNVK